MGDGGARRDGRNVCSVCETLCLVCKDCRETRHEHYCPSTRTCAGAYCWFLDACDAAAIDKQADALRAALEAPRASGVREPAALAPEAARPRRGAASGA